MSFSAPVSNLRAPRPGLFSCLQQPRQQGDSHPQPSGAAWPASADCAKPGGLPSSHINCNYIPSLLLSRSSTALCHFICLLEPWHQCVTPPDDLSPPECALTALCFALIRCILDQGTVGGHFSATFCFVLGLFCFFYRHQERIVWSEKEIRQHGSSAESDTLQPVDFFFFFSGQERLEMTHQGCTIPAARPPLMCSHCCCCC